MKIVKNIAAQGDVLFVRVNAIPDGARRSSARPVVVAHSETGHHHAIDDTGVVLFHSPADPLVCYLRVDGEYADVVHHRPWDTHETLRLPRGTWEVRRQREWAPEGWRRVED